MNKPICSLPDCGKPHVARGWCRNHYTNWNRTGNPIATRIRINGGRACDFPGCERPHDSRGLCGGHNAQRKAGKDLVPLAEWRKATDRDEEGRKQCRTCDGWFPEGEYAREKKTTDGLRSICNECERARKRLSTYGVTADAYAALLEAQGGVCAVCRGLTEDGRELAIDHDHACCPGRKSCGRCVRGLLCSSCNLAIGLLKENAALLTVAASYLLEVRAGAV